MVTIATHSGSFHADDVCGVAILREIHGDGVSITRTRDPQEIAAADFAVDVGGQWDAALGRFDHHQKGFNGKRASGVVYASAGLVWSAHGTEFLRKVLPATTNEEALELARRVDDELIQHLDMADTGAAQGAPGRFGLSMIVDAYNVTREEQDRHDGAGRPVGARRLTDCADQNFLWAVQTMQTILQRVGWHAFNGQRSEALVRNAEQRQDGRILVLPAAGLDWIPVVCSSMPDVRFVVYPESTGNQFQVRTVPVAPESFEAKLDLPEAWAGLRDQDLANLTGVKDAVFCHNARFICGAATRDGAISLAELALRA